VVLCWKFCRSRLDLEQAQEPFCKVARIIQFSNYFERENSWTPSMSRDRDLVHRGPLGGVDYRPPGHGGALIRGWVNFGAQKLGEGISRLQGISVNANKLCHDMQPNAFLI
jgi:hypothetical protein